MLAQKTPITSNPCPECGKLHSVLGTPYRDIDLETGTVQYFQTKQCICGYSFPRLRTLYFAGNAWRQERVDPKVDEVARGIYQLYAAGFEAKEIANILHHPIGTVQSYIVKYRQVKNALIQPQ